LRTNLPTHNPLQQQQIMNDDLIVEIFAFLEQSTLLHSVCLVNKHMYSMCRSPYVWRNRTVMLDFHPKNMCVTQEGLLFFKEANISNYTVSAIEWLIPLVAIIHTIDTLKIYGSPLTDEQKLQFPQLTTLKSITLSYLSTIENSFYLSKCPNITELSFRFEEAFNIKTIYNFHYLKRLSIRLWTVQNEDSLYELFDTFKLEYLELNEVVWNIKNHDVWSYLSKAKYWHHLKQLLIDGTCNTTTTTTMTTNTDIIKSNLKHLKLWFNLQNANNRPILLNTPSLILGCFRNLTCLQLLNVNYDGIIESQSFTNIMQLKTLHMEQVSLLVVYTIIKVSKQHLNELYLLEILMNENEEWINKAEKLNLNNLQSLEIEKCSIFFTFIHNTSQYMKKVTFYNDKCNNDSIMNEIQRIMSTWLRLNHIICPVDILSMLPATVLSTIQTMDITDSGYIYDDGIDILCNCTSLIRVICNAVIKSHDRWLLRLLNAWQSIEELYVEDNSQKCQSISEMKQQIPSLRAIMAPICSDFDQLFMNTPKLLLFSSNGIYMDSQQYCEMIQSIVTLHVPVKNLLPFIHHHQSIDTCYYLNQVMMYCVLHISMHVFDLKDLLLMCICTMGESNMNRTGYCSIKVEIEIVPELTASEYIDNVTQILPSVIERIQGIDSTKKLQLLQYYSSIVSNDEHNIISLLIYHCLHVPNNTFEVNVHN
jgi:hypothetical protein